MGHFMLARALQVAAELDLFTHLVARPVPIRELADQLNVNRRGLEALLAVCVSLHLVEKTDRGYRTAEAAASLLDAGRQGNVVPLLAGASGLYRDWVDLDQAIRCGAATAPAPRERGPDTLRAFLLEMHRAAIPIAQSVAGAVKLDSAGSLLDIGSGIGTFALAFRRCYPDLRATLFDLPEVIAIAEPLLVQSEIAEYVRPVGGDYHQDPLPPGHDVHLLCNVLHQENEEEAQRLLRQVYSALGPKGILIYLDAVLDDDKCGPLSVALGALNQLIHHSGATYYSAAEVSRWLRDAGFRRVERKPFPFPNQALLVATKLD
jgi:SAM-dependent methyltransferase